MQQNVSEAKADPKFVHQINNQKFYIEIWMYNQLDDSKFPPFAVDFYFVKGLAIEENLSTWVARGWIVLSNDFEMFERGSLSKKNLGAKGGDDRKKIEAPFLFRSDGRNKISIRIYPISNSTDAGIGSTDTELPPEQWEMSYDFVIYDIEDLPTGSSAKKLRKFYFWDERYQLMLERNIEWSTSLYGPNAGNIGSKDADRAMPICGLSNINGQEGAIESIIKTAASNESSPSSPVIMVGSTQGPSGIGQPDIPLNNFNEKNWDSGSKDSTVQYTSPANSNVIEDINYVFRYAKAKDNSPLFLTFDRYLKQWGLVPLSYYFENAKQNQIERIVLALGEDPLGTEPRVDRAPMDQSSNIQNFQSGIASKITSYKLSPMVSLDDMALTNKPLHTYDFSLGQFNITYTGNKITDLTDNMGKMAQSGLFGYQNSNQLLININKTKTLGLNVKNMFQPTTYVKDTQGITNLPGIGMQYDFIFLNQSIFFSAPGLTLRTPGKFLFIDREVSTGEYNPFDDKCIGQWMITKVTHLFTKTKYTTDVIANKIDIFHSWWEEVDSNTNY